MKTILISIAASALLASLAMAQTATYTILDLGTLEGGAFSQASYVDNLGLIAGVAAAADGSQHAVAWAAGQIIDLAGKGLGGPNTAVFGVNAKGQVVGQAEGTVADLHHENFCGYGTGFVCLPFLSQKGKLTPLPLPGGFNGAAGPINLRGEATGVAETAVYDRNCTLGKAVNGTGPQIYDYEAVVWGPAPGQLRVLRPPAGDTVGMGLWINESGQVAGATGSCSDTILPPFAGGRRAVIWDKDGTPHDLGNLGGTGNPASLGIVNVALVVNNRGQATGASVLHGNTNINAFLWTKESGMKSLGTLEGNQNSAGLGMNDLGDIVGASIEGTPQDGFPSAFVWRSGVMTDLNESLTPDSAFHHLLLASSINDAGVIVGFGLTGEDEVHGYVAIPNHAIQTDVAKAVHQATGSKQLPAGVRKALSNRFGFGGR